MRELIHVQVGQCGNQVGTKFWETVAFEEKNTIVVLLYFLIISFFPKPCTRLKKVKIYDNWLNNSSAWYQSRRRLHRRRRRQAVGQGQCVLQRDRQEAEVRGQECHGGPRAWASGEADVWAPGQVGQRRVLGTHPLICWPGCSLLTTRCAGCRELATTGPGVTTPRAGSCWTRWRVSWGSWWWWW